MEQTYAIEIIHPSDLENLTSSDNVIELTDIGIIGLDSLCRICANRSDNLIPIYEGEGVEYQLEMKINRHFPFTVEKSDALPTHCCYQCASTLLTWHELVEASIEADKRLKALQFETVVQLNQKFENLEEHNGSIVEPEEETTVNIIVPTTIEPRCEEHSLSKSTTTSTNHVDKGPTNDESIKYIRIRTETVSRKNIPHPNCKIVKILEPPQVGDFEYKPKIDPLFVVKSIFLCQTCEITFDSNSKFQKHLDIHHRKDGAENIPPETTIVDMNNFQCPICFEKFLTKSEWFEHNSEKTHALILKCEFCNSLFCHEQYLMCHKLECSLNYFCNFCSTAFQSINDFNKHLANQHYVCKICNKQMKSIVDLKSHRRTHLYKKNKRYSCLKCYKSFVSKSGLSYHQQQSHSEQTIGYKCFLCHVTFQNENLLKYHILHHDTSKNLECEICFKVFKRTCNLNAHLTTHIKDIYCKVCCSSFISQFRLENHLSIHSDNDIAESELIPKSVQCPFDNCLLNFPSRLQLYEHKKTHLDIVEYPCQDCNRKFKTESQLETHLKIHHQSDTNCNICGKHFSTLKTLTEHIRVHTGEKPFVCTICRAEFRCQSSFVGHRAIHNTERRYMCGICKRTFARASYLKEHLRTHRKERPYHCMYCTKTFTQSNVLKTHISLRHQTCWICKNLIGNKLLMRVHLLKEHNVKFDFSVNKIPIK